jgi:hypothetical protein
MQMWVHDGQRASLDMTEEPGRRGDGRRIQEGPIECAGKPVAFDPQDTHGSCIGST